jgi:ubiquitin carboxyl-terminal hydrolase 22/27/51
LSLCEHTNNMW